MNFNDIQVMWDSQNVANVYTIDENALSRWVKSRSQKFDRKILIRDTIEILGGLLAGGFFVIMGAVVIPAKTDMSWFDFWYLYLVSAGCFFVGGYLWYGRRQAQKQVGRFGTDVRASIEKAIWSIQRQIKLLSNVFWWYLLPFLPGVFFTVYSSSNHNTQWLRWTSVIALFVGIYLLNKAAVKRKLLPMKQELDGLLEKLISSE